MKKIINFLIHPFIIAIPFTVALLVLLPPIFKKYTGSIDNVFTLPQGTKSKMQYIDINNDGFSERIHIYRWWGNSTAVEVFGHDEALIDQYNFPGLVFAIFDVMSGDYNNNGYDEIYFFTLVKDSLLYVNQLEFINDSDVFKKSRFVSIVNLHNKKPDTGIAAISIVDLNHDNYREILFNVLTGYALQPRNIFSWDIRNDTIYKSPMSYAYLGGFSVTDLDGDGFVEIIGGCSSAGNTHEKVATPFHDNSAWLMEFDHELKFKYPPIEFKGFGSRIGVEFVEKQGKKNLMIFEKNILKGKQYAKLKLFSFELKLLKERKINDNPGRQDFIQKQWSNGKSLIWLTHYPQKYIENIDSDLKTGRKISFPNRSLQFMDVDRDKNMEAIYWNNEYTKLYVARPDFSHPVEYNIPEFMGENYETRSVRLNGNAPAQFGFQRGNKLSLLNYNKNSYYFLKYPTYLLVYVIFSLFFYLIQRIQKKRLEERYATEREITQLQMRTIKNQADPHFIFNALNSISSIIYKEDKDTAYNVLNDFSALIRSAIVNSDKISINLAEELSFIENYLKLEKIRFKAKFDYFIQVENTVDKTIQVPRMLLQTYVENAIKHGIMHADYACRLSINIRQKDKNLLIEIDDNGIGRKESQKYAQYSTGVGLKIITRMFALYEKLYGKKIIQIIEDKTDENSLPNGTKVLIKLPI